jgi:hypothetical protein
VESNKIQLHLFCAKKVGSLLWEVMKLAVLTWPLCITSSMDNIHNIHHSEIFLSPLLFEDIMDSSSGKLQELSL